MKLFIRMSEDGARVDSICVDPRDPVALFDLDDRDVVVIAPDEVYNVEVVADRAVIRELRAEADR